MLGKTDIRSSDYEMMAAFGRDHATAMVSVVFCDMVASTEALESVGEKKFLAAVSGYFSRTISVIEEDPAGRVVKHLGDGFLAVFNSPKSAIERCLAVHDAPLGGSPRLRIGIDVGDVSVLETHGGQDVFGKHVNRASRVQAAASPGTSFTSFTAYDLSVGWLRDSVRWVKHPGVRLKGFSDPLDLYEAKKRGEEPTFTDSPEIRSLTAALRESGSKEPGKRRLLWVDDYPENNCWIFDRLSRLGFSIVAAESTTIALRLIARMEFLAVLSDMGRQNEPRAGLSLLKKMRSLGYDLPVLFFTSPDAAVLHRPDALQAGAELITAGTATLLEGIATVVREANR